MKAVGVAVSAALCALVGSVVLLGQAPRQPDPLVRENATVKVSPHVYVIPDDSVPLVPNVGIIVGARATLVVDTGLGPRNGQTVLREVAKVSRNADLFVISTHFHPEHALGEPAFPASATLIRSTVQQKDIDELGPALAQTFSERTALTRELLQGVQYRPADRLFDGDDALDLGGVRVQMLSLGPTHTRGDVGIFVEGDGVLFSGDVVMNRAFLAVASPYASVRAWLSSLDRLDALHPVRVVPSHGPMGDGALVGADREYLAAVQARVRTLKGQGVSVADAAKAISVELQAKYPDWTGPMRITGAVTAAFAEAP